MPVSKLNLGINAIKVLERRYLLRDSKGNIIETPSQLFRRVAKAIALVEKKYGKSKKEVRKLKERFYQMMINQEFFPNTPTLMNAGSNKLGNLSGCYVLKIEDNLESIFDTLKLQALIQREAGGTGFDFSELRPKGDYVKTTGGVSSGLLSL